MSILPVLFAVAASALLILGLLRFARHIDLVDRPNSRKCHDRETPLVGGLGMLGALIITLLFFGPLIGEWGQHGIDLLSITPFVLGALLLASVGLIDDYTHVHHNYRFVAQAGAALIMVYWGGVQVESLGNLFGSGEIELGLLAGPFTLFATVGFINAYNMLDGLDGLALMVGLAILGVLLLAAPVTGNSELLPLLLLLIAVLAGFALFNLRFPWQPQARAFMGDAGSNWIGYAIAWCAIDTTSGNSDIAGWVPIGVLWLLGLPVIDTFNVVFTRLRSGRSPFAPDKQHIHHILQGNGQSVSATSFTIAAITALFGVIGLFGYLLHTPEALMLVGFIITAVLLHITLAQLRNSDSTGIEAPLTADEERS